MLHTLPTASLQVLLPFIAVIVMKIIFTEMKLCIRGQLGHL